MMKRLGILWLTLLLAFTLLLGGCEMFSASETDTTVKPHRPSDYDTTTVPKEETTTLAPSGNGGGNVPETPSNTVPVVGVPYKLTASNADSTLYFDGTVSDGRFNAVTTAANAMLVYVENAANTGEYLLYFMNGSTKTYIVMNDSSTGGDLTDSASAATVFEWNTEYKTMMVADDANSRAMGTSKTGTFKSFSAYDLSSSSNVGKYNYVQFLTAGSASENPNDNNNNSGEMIEGGSIRVPAYSGSAYAVINNNNPYFTTEELTTTSYERYDPLDSLGRCTETMACIGRDLMPTEDREDLTVNPTGWRQATYDVVPGNYLYNRCHLIAFQLTGENSNDRNLITGTQAFNKEMLKYENMVAAYIKETGNHVLYRVTPLFEGNNLVATGVLMEAYSVEDDGDGICFNVFLYNVQAEITIDYATGISRLTNPSDDAPTGDEIKTYVLNISSLKFHTPTCSWVGKMNASNREDYTGSRNDLIAAGYNPCGTCKP